MVDPKVVQKQLDDAGCNFSFFGKPEVKELPTILQPGEVIAQCVNGFYENGFAMLCVTNERLLMIDRKTFFMTVEDIHFDMVAEIDHSRRLFTSMAKIFTPNKSLSFSTFDQTRLQKCIDYLQQRVMESRQKTGSQGIDLTISKPTEEAGEEPNVANELPGHAADTPPMQPQTVDRTNNEDKPMESNVFARVAVQGIDRATAQRQSTLPLFRRRRYPAFYTR